MRHNQKGSSHRSIVLNKAISLKDSSRLEFVFKIQSGEDLGSPPELAYFFSGLRFYPISFLHFLESFYVVNIAAAYYEDKYRLTICY